VEFFKSTYFGECTQTSNQDKSNLPPGLIWDILLPRNIILWT